MKKHLKTIFITAAFVIPVIILLLLLSNSSEEAKMKAVRGQYLNAVLKSTEQDIGMLQGIQSEMEAGHIKTGKIQGLASSKDMKDLSKIAFNKKYRFRFNGQNYEKFVLYSNLISQYDIENHDNKRTLDDNQYVVDENDMKLIDILKSFVIYLEQALHHNNNFDF